MFQELLEQYKTTKVETERGVRHDLRRLIKLIELYSNSMYESGEYDEMGNVKPFYNIVNYAVNVATRSTDFDTKDLQVIAKSPEYRMKSFILRKELQRFMEENSMDLKLNEAGETRARHGGVLIKKFETKDDISLEVMDWRNTFFHGSKLLDSPIIERHYMSPLDLAKKRDAWDGLNENWHDVMDLFEEEDEDGNPKTTIEVYEVTGELPLSLFEEDAEDWEYSLQKHFVLIEEDIELHKEEIKEIPFKYLDWESVSGRSLGRGVVEQGFEAQTWVNDNVIREKQAMELASKIVFKTTDDMLADNLLTDLYNGDIIKLKNGDLSPVNTVSNAIPQFDNTKQSWESQYEKATSTFAAITGETLPANTPLGSVQIQNAEARSVYDYRREEMGIFLKDIIKDWILPHLTKKINKEHILMSSFTDDELDMIDEAFSEYRANEEVIDLILDREVVTQEDRQLKKELIKEELMQDEDRRYLEVPKDYFKNIDVEIDIVTTNEQYNKQAQLQSLSQMLSIAGQNPQLLDDPRLAPIFANMVELSGVGVSPSIFKKASRGANVSSREAEKAGEAFAQEEEQPVNQ